MLDEILERKLCTYSLAENGAKWQYLSGTNLKNDLAGLNRAMTIVARGFIMDCGGYRNDITMDERIKIADDTKTYLKMWCGFLNNEEKNSFTERYKDKPELSGIIARSDGWFPGYLAAIYNELTNKFKKRIDTEKDMIVEIHESVKAEINECISGQQRYINGLFEKSGVVLFPDVKDSGNDQKGQEPPHLDKIIESRDHLEQLVKSAKGIDRAMESIIKFRDKKTQFPRSLFSEKLQDSTSKDNKKLCYDSIIADAFNEGPLKRRVLAAASDPLGKLLIKKKKTDETNKIYALTAHCLLNNGVKADGKTAYCILVKTDMSNWVQLSKDGFNDGVLQKFEFNDDNGEPIRIFELRTDLIAGNTCKIKINKNWITLCGFEILESAENETSKINSVVELNGKEYRIVLVDDEEKYLSKSVAKSKNVL